MLGPQKACDNESAETKGGFWLAMVIKEQVTDGPLGQKKGKAYQPFHYQINAKITCEL